MHGFWRELPNYNPIGVESSEPGTDHAAAALALFDAHPNKDGGHNDEDRNEPASDLEDGRSETSKVRDGSRQEYDDGTEFRTISSDPPSEEFEDYEAPHRQVRSHSTPKSIETYQ